MKFIDLKGKKGITILALSVTIIILLILAGVSVATIRGNNGIVVNASKTKFMTELRDIQEQIEIEEIQKNNGEEFQFGTLKDLINREDGYNEILCMENGELVYEPNKVSEKQAEWLEDMQISSKKGIIPIYTEEQLRKCATGETIQIEELNGMEYVFSKDGHYILQNDINTITEWKPLQNFSGIFDGNNYIINNILLNNAYDALFSTNSGIIENLGITINDSSLGSNISGIATYNNGYIINCTHKSKEITVTSISGIVFSNSKYVIGSCNKSDNTNANSYGIANVNYGVVIGCYNTGTFNNTSWKNAGIVGTNYQSGIITKCYNWGDLKSSSHTIAGIVAQNLGTISSCYNVGNISGGLNTGGIVGRNSEGQVKNCYYLNSSANSLIGIIDSGEVGVECTSKTTIEMQTQDFVDNLNIFNENIDIDYSVSWEKGNEYPKIKCQAIE